MEKTWNDGEEEGDLYLQLLVPKLKASVLAQGHIAAIAYGLRYFPLPILPAHPALQVL